MPDLLEAVDESTVRTEFEVFHDILQADEVSDVEARRVLELVGGGIEVEEVDRAAERLGVRDERRAKRRFARPSGSGHENGVCRLRSASVAGPRRA